MSAGTTPITTTEETTVTTEKAIPWSAVLTAGSIVYGTMMIRPNAFPVSA